MKNFSKFTLSAFHLNSVYDVVSFDGEIFTGKYISQQFMGARYFLDASPGWKLNFKNEKTGEILEILYMDIRLVRELK